MTVLSDAGHMLLALAAGRTALGTTAPNPAVGAVLVRAGEVIGTGATQPPGGRHAERMALQDAIDRGRDPAGATLYVTLEPCCHEGRTPPCTSGLIAAGIARVVVGVLDPFHAVRGRGVELLRSAGIQVDVGIEAAACAALHLGFARAVTRGLPEVTLKTATSADGHIATASGESQWITGPEARAVGQELRATHDAIVVGIHTVLQDDPRLTTRLRGRPSPVPVVMDRQGRFPRGCLLDRPETLVFTTCSDLQTDAAQVVVSDAGDVGVAWEPVLRSLVSRGLLRVLVEGGGGIGRTLLDGGWVDTIEQFIAGKVIPGGRSWVGGPPLESLAVAPSFTLASVDRVGEDAWISWRATHRAPPDWV